MASRPILQGQKRIPTDQELMDLPKDGYKRELLHGKIVLTPGWCGHGAMIARFAARFGEYIYQHELGCLYDGQTGFRMASRDVLSPDLSFVTRERLESVEQNPAGFFEGAPDLAIEFLSSGESKKRLKQKLTQYFQNGTRLAWVMDSERRIIAVHRGAAPDRILTEADELSGEELVPGFRIPVADVLAGLWSGK